MAKENYTDPSIIYIEGELTKNEIENLEDRMGWEYLDEARESLHETDKEYHFFRKIF